MTEEEQRAVKRLEDFEDLSVLPVYMREDFRIISKLIQNQQEEIEEKDKQIELMNKYIHIYGSERICILTDKNNKCTNNCKECIERYFERKVEEERKYE